jgi:hypothetical protein
MSDDNTPYLWAVIQWLNRQQRQVVFQRVSARDCITQASPTHHYTTAVLCSVLDRNGVLGEGGQQQACKKQFMVVHRIALAETPTEPRWQHWLAAALQCMAEVA